MVWPPLPGIWLINIFIQLIIQFCPHGDKDLSLEFHIKYDINLSNRSVQLITNPRLYLNIDLTLELLLSQTCDCLEMRGDLEFPHEKKSEK